MYVSQEAHIQNIISQIQSTAAMPFCSHTLHKSPFFKSPLINEPHWSTFDNFRYFLVTLLYYTLFSFKNFSFSFLNFYCPIYSLVRAPSMCCKTHKHNYKRQYKETNEWQGMNNTQQ